MAEYISFDRADDALMSLELLCRSIEEASNDLRHWKYVIVSAHNALQGFICMALCNGNDFNIIKEQHLKKWLKAHQEDESYYPDTQLDYFMKLYDRLFTDAHGLDRNLISQLNITRNIFVHFNTDSFSVHQKLAISSCKEALRAIELSEKNANGLFFYHEAHKNEFDNLLARANVLLSEYTPH